MSRHRNGLVSAVLPASVWNMCKRTIGVPQELGRACRFLGTSRLEPPGHQLQAWVAHSPTQERTERVQAEVPPSEGNEARRDERQEVIAP